MIIVTTTLFLCLSHAYAAPSHCDSIIKAAHLSSRFNETIAHAIHSMTVEGLRMFNPRATENNNVPTVNQNVFSGNLVLPHAPHSLVGHDFSTHTMNVIDKVLSELGKPTDGLGPNWSPIERVAHIFHMHDLWAEIRKAFDDVVKEAEPSTGLCSCLTDTDHNGIRKAVGWVADHYKTGTPITLLNRPIPKLTDANTWQIWKDRLLHYYTEPAIRDAAIYLYCAVKDM